MPIKMLLQIESILVVIIAFLGYFSYLLYSSGQNLSRWESSKWKIISIAVLSKTKPTVMVTAGGSMQKYWMVDVTYEYTVKGIKYIGKELSNSPPMENQDFHIQPSHILTDYLIRYPIDKEVDVFYSWNHPDKSYLEIVTNGYKGFLYATIVVCIIALWLIIFRIILH